MATSESSFHRFLRETFYLFAVYVYNLNVYFQLLIRRKLPGLITMVIIGICILATIVIPQLWDYDKDQCYSVMNIVERYQLWMLIYSSFVHQDVWNHLLGNLPLLIWFAKPVEEEFGSIKFTLLSFGLLLLEGVLRLPIIVGFSMLLGPDYDETCFLGLSGFVFALFVVNLFKYPENLFKIDGLDQIYSRTRITAIVYCVFVLISDVINHLNMRNVFFVHWPGLLTGFLCVGAMAIRDCTTRGLESSPRSTYNRPPAGATVVGSGVTAIDIPSSINTGRPRLQNGSAAGTVINGSAPSARRIDV